MRWLCCCDSCWFSSSKSETMNDATVLVQNSAVFDPVEHRVQPFYVPRRHSSYNTGSLNPVLVQPRSYNSDSCSSSGDDDIPPMERGRCWSTVAPSNASDVASLVRGLRAKQVDVSPPWSPSKSSTSSQEDKHSVTFDKHILTEIAETDGSPVSENSPTAENYFRWENEDFGALTFKTTYDDQEQKLAVYVKKATNLPTKGSFPYYDTYVKMVITSARKNYRISRPARKSMNPNYDEEFIIHMSRSKWKSSRSHFLRLSIFDCDRNGRHDAIGHVTVPIMKILEDRIQNYTLQITPMSLPLTSLGQVLLGLAYSPTQSRLSINVIKGRHLKLDIRAAKYNFRTLNKGKDAYDTFAKVTLMCGGSKVKTSRSSVIVDCTDPMYNHKSHFVVPAQFLFDSSVVITITMKGVLGRSAPLGRVTVGPYTETASGVLTHWGKMVQDCRSVVKWRNLYL